jgi:type IV pili sensor histidine kinase/response regulator
MAVMGGCTTHPPADENAQQTLSEPTPMTPVAIMAVRHGRYTLVEALPEAGQRDLMQQIVETTIPPTLDANVGGALRHVLARSGYRLCATHEVAALAALPLPAAHYRLGPMTLADALKVLVGSSWTLNVDELTRRICFTRTKP